MKCHVCGGEMEKVVSQFPFKISDESIVIIKNMPVLQCTGCAEYLIEDEVMEKVEETCNGVDATAELEVFKYAS